MTWQKHCIYHHFHFPAFHNPGNSHLLLFKVIGGKLKSTRDVRDQPVGGSVVKLITWLSFSRSFLYLHGILPKQENASVTSLFIVRYATHRVFVFQLFVMVFMVGWL